ncbi:ferrous iron transport protein B [Erysipelotrichaceae bacterium AF15-26LB]|nr:ferrous iron transport protein B [[Clostridium] innocuum]RJV88441.1 ferrous iron transport protein B [Erysipelotrichaceae bacterium AF19-24AC]RJV90243.1 ferrous iron transport protein B [Erysipelotrichaceae bacterium AF15-26LB]
MRRIALAGNPNCGKTTMFNALTGSNQYVGNWPGVTVEKKEGKLKGYKDIILTDLPGIYSLSPYSLDEVVARNYLIEERPDLIINIIDATNLERNLYLTTQLQETGIPVIAALNMMDLIQQETTEIDTGQLSRLLHIPVIEVSALKNRGLDELIEKAVGMLEDEAIPYVNIYSGMLKDALTRIAELPSIQEKGASTFWYAVKYLEDDEKVLTAAPLNGQDNAIVAKLRKELEAAYDDDAESIITNERYAYLAGIIKQTYVKRHSGMRISDRIDHIVTNRWLALPIFAVVMYLVYYVSVTTVGTYVTDWTNDVLFGDIIPPAVTSFLEGIGTAGWLVSLIVDGIIAGIGAVLGFVPQMLVLFLFLAILEDCGYMARIAFIMDRVFRKFGLSGKSFIPMLIGTGCGVPGIMASRTIESEKDRRMTIMTTTFIPCSAKLPIIALIAGALFQGASWVAPSAYFVGIAAVICSGIMLKKTRLFAGDPSPFVMELPAYHIPKALNVLRSMWERGWSFIKKAGSIILLSTIFIWFTSNFGMVDGSFTMLEESQLNESFLANLGSAIAPLFAPLGWGEWQASVAAITGLVAKENVVATFGILYGFGEVAEDGVQIWGTLAAGFTVAAAYSFLVFNLLCAPCFAAIGAIKREMNNAKWTIFAVAYQCIFAYAVAFMIFQFATFFTTGVFTIGTVIALLVLLVLLVLLFRPESKRQVASVKANANA